MKKLFVIGLLLLVSVSLFAQDVEQKDGVEKSVKKNVLRLHLETLYVFEGDANQDSWAAGSWDYALGGLGLSYSRLFNDSLGITMVVGVLAGGVEDPFSENYEEKKIDFFAGSYPFDIDRVGAFAKIGPYFRFGRFAFSLELESAGVIKRDPDTSYTEVDQLVGISLGFEFFVTDSFLIYVEGSVLGGHRVEGASFWGALNNSEDDDAWFFDFWNSYDSSRLMACSLTLGMGLAF